MELELLLKNNFTGMTDEYSQFVVNKNACRQCSVYDDYSASPIQSEGCVKEPMFMFIGEAPGVEEIQKNQPFIGAAGQRLRKELRKYGEIFNKETTLISNLLSCRPMQNKFPSANPKEYTIAGVKGYTGALVVKHCYYNWLCKEIDIVKPKIIVTVGSHSLNLIRDDKSITQHHGTWKRLENRDLKWCYSLYHPSYVLRCANNKDMRHIEQQFEEDIKNLAETYEDHLD